MRTLIGLVAALTLAAGMTAAAPATATTTARVADRDCGDFSSQAAAQSFYLKAGGPDSDPHGLDADDDGIACDSNPCPCSDRTSSGTKPPAAKPARPKPLHVVRELATDRAQRGRIAVSAKVLTHRGGTVMLQKSRHRGWGYRTFVRKQTHLGGKFRAVFRAAVGTHVRLLVPETTRNRLTTVYVGRVVRR